MNVIDIVRIYLEQHGYDGLFCPAWDCACLVGDLVPCDGIWLTGRCGEGL